MLLLLLTRHMLAASFVAAQIDAGEQPETAFSVHHGVGTCCAARQMGTAALDDCLKGVLRRQRRVWGEMSSKIGILSFYDANLRATFAPYAQFVNAAWAETHGHAMVLEDDHSAGEWREPRDIRWTKIGVMLKALEPGGWCANCKGVAWVDADLAVISFGLDLAALMASSPQASVWMSQDAHPRGWNTETCIRLALEMTRFPLYSRLCLLHSRGALIPLL